MVKAKYSNKLFRGRIPLCFSSGWNVFQPIEEEAGVAGHGQNRSKQTMKRSFSCVRGIISCRCERHPDSIEAILPLLLAKMGKCVSMNVFKASAGSRITLHLIPLPDTFAPAPLGIFL